MTLHSSDPPGHSLPHPNTSTLAGFLRRGEVLRGLPIAARYAIAAAIVLACFAIRYALDDIYREPYLIFLIGVILVSFVLDRGSGFVATALSALVVIYFFNVPRGSFAFLSVGQFLGLSLFVAVGLLAATAIETLRLAVEDLAIATQELSDSRRQLGSSLSILETVLECSPDPLFVRDTDGRLKRVNSAGADLLGADANAIIGKRVADFLPRKQAQQLEALDRKVLETEESVTCEHQLSRIGTGDNPRWMQTTKAPWYGPDRSLLGVVEITRDIHEHRQAQEALKATSAQKDILLHDLNHRVKNHLQSIMSTFSMSLRDIEDPAARSAIQGAQSRLSVLARVYDRLRLRDEGEAVVNIRDFVNGLCSDLQPALIGLQPLALNLRVEPIHLELGRAVPIGLIVNEALTNSVKYGFPDEAAGNITVLFERRGDRLHLEISDDGVGMPSEDRRTGIGSRLIRALCQQLEGTVDWDGPPGTSVIVTFPLAGSRADCDPHTANG